VPVVVMLPAGQGVGAMGRVLVRPAVGPLSQGGLDEAFGLAVGLRSVGSSELVLDASALQELAKSRERNAEPVSVNTRLMLTRKPAKYATASLRN